MENFAQNYVKFDIFVQKGGKSKISGGSPPWILQNHKKINIAQQVLLPAYTLC